MELDEESYRHQKKSRKKKFFVQRRCLKVKFGALHEMYLRYGWYDWHRHRAYETEKARDQAIVHLSSSSGGNRLPGDWEYRKES